MRAILIVLVCFAATGCCRKPISSSYAEKDSVRTEYVNRYIETVRDTTIYIPVPVERIVERGIPVDSSHMETSIAESDAWIDSLGRLNHSLSNKDTVLSAPAQIKDTQRADTVRVTEYKYRDRTETIRERYIPKFFWYCLAISILSVGYVIWTMYRKSRLY